MISMIGIKTQQGQKFLENGIRIPVTYVNVAGNTVISVKTSERDNYSAIQLGMGEKKRASKSLLGHAKGAGLTSAPIFLREVKLEEETDNIPAVGDKLNPLEVLKPGDIINVTGLSKGKGFAGGVKRHNFSGGPKTHGQSDRHRAPGSIGQGTTPGRVYKGKRMAGRMGNEQVTVRNLKVVDVTDDQVLIEGLVPGILGGLIVIKKVGEAKKFVPLYQDPGLVAQEAEEEAPAEASEEPAVSDVPQVETPVAQEAEAPAEAQSEANDEATTPEAETIEEAIVKNDNQEKKGKEDSPANA